MSPEKLYPPKNLDLRDIPTDSSPLVKLDKETTNDELKEIIEKIASQQIIFHAEKKNSILFVLQGMDSSGKDGVIKKVIAPSIHPLGIEVSNFKKPSGLEQSHDYLWRVHNKMPKLGHVGVFNRSHYEDVVVPQVWGKLDKEKVKQRYRQINDFERMLSEEGTIVKKIFLHISPAEQKERLINRQKNYRKHWKFSLEDIKTREKWPECIDAYNSAIVHTHSAHAPWHIVPADRKWLRNFLVAKIIEKTISDHDSKFPELSPELKVLEIPDASW